MFRPVISPGTSRAALDVLTGVAAEYLSNVGRTIRFLCDKYSTTMTPEVKCSFSSPVLLVLMQAYMQEIILHTLFECGTSKVQDLERYVSDDVQRHGSRLAELEKKLVSAYRDAVRVASFYFFVIRITWFTSCWSFVDCCRGA